MYAKIWDFLTPSSIEILATSLSNLPYWIRFSMTTPSPNAYILYG